MSTDYVINTDRFKNLFNELETRTNLLTTLTELHKSITNHFTSLEQSLSQESQALDSRIEAFEAQSNKTLESLENRENGIPERESSTAARIEELKESAISEIEKSEKEEGQRSLSDWLKVYCRRMDSGGLVRFLLQNRRELVALRTELAAAMEESVDPMRLVLGAVEELVEKKAEGVVGVADTRWATGMLIQVTVPVEESSGGGVGAGMRDRATGVLEKWKGLIRGRGGDGGLGGGEASMFLTMVVGFGLKGLFGDEFLRKMVVEFSARRDMAKLALGLGLGKDMGDIIDGLVKSGKEIEAVYFVCESGLTQQFSPVTLLKTNLRNCRKNANNISKKKYGTEEANSFELNATRAIIKCVEDNKLESEFPLDSLRTRVAQLDKAKADKKTGVSTGKPLNKRAHGGGSGSGWSGGALSSRPLKSGRFSNPSPSSRHLNPSLSARFAAPYNYPNPSVYDGPGAVSYGPGYHGAHAQIPAAGGARAVGSYGVPEPYGGQSNYSSCDYSAAAAVSYSSSYS